MTQNQAQELHQNARQTIEQQRAEAVELAKIASNLRQEEYRLKLIDERYLKERIELEEKIRQAEIYKENAIKEIEKEAVLKLEVAERILKDNAEKARELQEKLNQEKERQDQELRQNELSNEEKQKQREELDKRQEQAKKEMLEAQAKADKECIENLEENLKAQQLELEERKQQLERQRELERQRQLEQQNKWP